MHLHAEETLLVATRRADHLKHVEAHGLRQRPALPRHNLIAGLNAEGGRDVHGRVLVALLETVVLLDLVKVVLTDDDGVLHLGGLDHTSDQLATDVHVAGPRALTVNVGAIDSRTRGLDAQTNALEVALVADALLGLAKHALLPNEDAILLLERPLVLPGYEREHKQRCSGGFAGASAVLCPRAPGLRH